MAWENATGFKDKINPFTLSDSLLALVDDSTSTVQQIFSGSGNLPDGLVINTNYCDLPTSGSGEYSAPFDIYAEDSALAWYYSSWTYSSRKGAGCQLITKVNNRTIVQQSILRNVTANPITAWSFIINHARQEARVVVLEREDNYSSIIVYTLNQSYSDGTNLYNALIANPYIPPTPPSYSGGGGGATHIAKVTGQLKDLSSNLSDILIVSGGGGGGMLVGETEYAGADAGGISGSGDNSADQSTGYAFGQGESGTDVSGGGGGLYGGYKGICE